MGNTTYINGVRIATMRKIAVFVFGDSFIDLIAKEKNNTVIIIKKGKIKEFLIKAFIDYWKIEVKEV